MHYNKKINILRVERTEDALGGQDETTSVIYANVACRINWTRGQHLILVKDKPTTYRDAKIFCRYIAEITTQHRIQIGDLFYEIISVFNPDEMNRYMVLEIKRIS